MAISLSEINHFIAAAQRALEVNMLEIVAGKRSGKKGDSLYLPNRWLSAGVDVLTSNNSLTNLQVEVIIQKMIEEGNLTKFSGDPIPYLTNDIILPSSLDFKITDLVDGPMGSLTSWPLYNLRVKSDGSGWEWYLPSGSSVGPGTSNYLSKFITPTTLGDSLFSDDGTNVMLDSSKFITSADPTKVQMTFGASGTEYFEVAVTDAMSTRYASFFGDQNQAYMSFGGSVNYLNINSNGTAQFAIATSLTIGTPIVLFDTSSVTIKGVDGTSANYALIVEDSGSTPIVQVRNDGNFTVGTLLNYDPNGRLSLKTGPSEAYSTLYNTFRIGQAGLLLAGANSNELALTMNYFYDGADKYLLSDPASLITMASDASVRFYSDPAGVSGAAYTPTEIMRVHNQGLSLAVNEFYSTYKLFVRGLGNTNGTYSGFFPKVGSVPILLLSDNGRVSIGMDTPAANLHVNGAGNTNATFTAQFHNLSGTSNTLIIRDDGHVGIGTSAPALNLDINGDYGVRQSPASPGVNLDNYATVGISFLRLYPSAPINITGFADGYDGKFLTIANVNLSSITLKDMDAGSAVANQMLLGGDIAIASNQMVTLWYDYDTTRWRLFSKNF